MGEDLEAGARVGETVALQGEEAEKHTTGF